MYAAIKGEKYPVDNVLTEGGGVKLVFSGLPLADVDALASDLPEELTICTDTDSEIFRFLGYTVATELRKNLSNDQVLLALRQPTESERSFQPLADQMNALAEAIERGLS